MIEELSNGYAESHSEWMTEWLLRDYSWDGLQNKRSWSNNNSETLRTYLSEMDNAPNDDALFKRGRLIDVPQRGVYHIAFVPDIWANEIPDLSISPEELIARKASFWQQAFHSSVRDTFKSEMEGVHINDDIARQIMENSRASFAWSFVDTTKIKLSSRGNIRSFKNCFIPSSVRISGNHQVAEGRPGLIIDGCTLSGTLEIADATNVGKIKLSHSLFTENLELVRSSIESFEISDSSIETFISFNSVIEGKLLLFLTRLASGVELSSTTFLGDVEVSECEVLEQVDLLRCNFKERVTFVDVSWPTVGFLVASASGSSFDGLATFVSLAPPPIQFFREAEFRGGLAIGDYTDQQWRSALSAEIAASTLGTGEERDSLRQAKNVEAACRNIRKIAEGQGDISSEHFWHRAEMFARRHRSDTRVSERFFSRLYQLSADYGISIVRPFSALIVLLMVCTVIYAYIGGQGWHGDVDWASVVEGLGFSLNRTLPIGVFGHEENAWRVHLLGNAGGLRSIGIRLLATAQTIFSAVLIYLGVMAIRRKFKIS